MQLVKATIITGRICLILNQFWNRNDNNFFPHPNIRYKEGFFGGAYIEKRGMVFWRESNKEELKNIYIYYSCNSSNIPFIYSLLILSFMTCILTHLSLFLLLIINLPY